MSVWGSDGRRFGRRSGFLPTLPAGVSIGGNTAWVLIQEAGHAGSPTGVGEQVRVGGPNRIIQWADQQHVRGVLHRPPAAVGAAALLSGDSGPTASLFGPPMGSCAQLRQRLPLPALAHHIQIPFPATKSTGAHEAPGNVGIILPQLGCALARCCLLELAELPLLARILKSCQADWCGLHEV